MARLAANDELVRQSGYVPERVRRTHAGNPILALWRALWDSIIGKKVIMAVTGGVLVLFVVGHMLGMLKTFGGSAELNAYSTFLRQILQPALGYGGALWFIRIVLLVCVVLHIAASVELTRVNQQARPIGYHTKRVVETTFAALTMRWSGALLLVFIVFHLLNLSAGVAGFAPGTFDPLNVYHNVVAGLSLWPVAAFYIIAMGALYLHLEHGLWSISQTLGWNTTRNVDTAKRDSRLIALAVAAGFASVPIAVLAGWIR